MCPPPKQHHPLPSKCIDIMNTNKAKLVSNPNTTPPTRELEEKGKLLQNKQIKEVNGKMMQCSPNLVNNINCKVGQVSGSNLINKDNRMNGRGAIGRSDDNLSIQFRDVHVTPIPAVPPSNESEGDLIEELSNNTKSCQLNGGNEEDGDYINFPLPVLSEGVSGPIIDPQPKPNYNRANYFNETFELKEMSIVRPDTYSHYANLPPIEDYQKKRHPNGDDTSSCSSGDLSEACGFESTDDLSSTSSTEASPKQDKGYVGDHPNYLKRHLTEKERMHQLLMRSRTSQRSSAYIHSSSNVPPQHGPHWIGARGGGNNICLKYLAPNYGSHPKCQSSDKFGNEEGSTSCFDVLGKECHSLDRPNTTTKRGPPNGNFVSKRLVGMFPDDRPISSISSIRKSETEFCYKNVSNYSPLVKENVACPQLGGGCHHLNNGYQKVGFNFFNVIDEELEHVVCQLEQLQFQLLPMDYRLGRVKDNVKKLQVYNSMVYSKRIHEERSLPKHSSVESLSSLKSRTSVTSKESSLLRNKLSGLASQVKRTLGANNENSIKSSIKQAFRSKKTKKRDDCLEESNECEALIKKLNDKDSLLTDIRLEVLDKSNEIEELKELLQKLETENCNLRNNLNSSIYVNSQQNSDHSSGIGTEICSNYTNESGSDIYVSLNSSPYTTTNRRQKNEFLQVFVMEDNSGNFELTEDKKSFIGLIQKPAKDVTWKSFDIEVGNVFQIYLDAIDTDKGLQISAKGTLFGYCIGESRRLYSGIPLPKSPFTLCTTSSEIIIFMRSIKQKSFDSLAFTTLIPKNDVEKLHELLIRHKRITIYGDISYLKENLINNLANTITTKIQSLDGRSYVECPRKFYDNFDKYLSSKAEVLITLMYLYPEQYNYVFEKVKVKKYINVMIVCCLQNEVKIGSTKNKDTIGFYSVQVNNTDYVLECGLRKHFFHLKNGISKSNDKFTESEVLFIKFLINVYQNLRAFVCELKGTTHFHSLLDQILKPPAIDNRHAILWFTTLWNDQIVPYSRSFLAKSSSTLTTTKEPLNCISSYWPWQKNLDARSLLSSILQNHTNQNFCSPEIDTSFDPLAALIRIQSYSSFGEKEEDGNENGGDAEEEREGVLVSEELILS
uniref:UDENN domain-containing protein n=1 Tax=Rhabditophanes sp. KR3021 TaxID=114890 RepID=A0AC35U8I0_9BILA